jgi:photoactive yellow protein
MMDVMADQNDPARDPAWYRDRWQELMDLLSASTPEEVLEQARSLRDAGFDRPEFAVQAIDSMEEQLEELYSEKEATEDLNATDVPQNGDTFDQLRILLAREEKLQRKLGISDPDDVAEMVEGLTEQLEDLYLDRDAEQPPDSIFGRPSEPSNDIERVLESELGTSDPEAVVEMMEGLTDQLDVLYENQEQLSAYGIEGIDHALAVIENMEAQLTELYDERHQAAEENDVPTLDAAAARLNELEKQLSTLNDEKARLQRKRDQLQSQFDELENELGTGKPEVITELVHSLEAQLDELYETREQDSGGSSSPEGDTPPLSEDTRARLPDMDPEALNALSVGLFRVDERGVVEWANEQALRWPDVNVDTPDALVGDHFFKNVAPATANDLFQGRFADGIEAGAMDEHFFYSYVGARAAVTNLMVHLYSSTDSSAHWIGFRILDRH